MNKRCTVFRATGLIGKKWTPTILLELYKAGGQARYSALKKKIPIITAKVLSERLKDLESEGLITKRVDTSTAPMTSEYSLTEGGESLIRIIKEIKEWALSHRIKNRHCDDNDCKDCLL